MKKPLLLFILSLALLQPSSTFAVGPGLVATAGGAAVSAAGNAAVSGIVGCGSGAVAGGAVGAAVAASASGIAVSDAGTHAQLAFSNAQLGIQTNKECVLDGLAYALAEGMLSALIRSTVDWVNNGFDGGPSYVTNLSQFLGEIADNTSLDFIQGTELGFLCSPFELDVRLTLALQRQPFRERIRCSLGRVVDNADRFFSGDFSQGGWPAWFRVHTDFRNNPYGSLYLVSSELNIRLNSRINEELTILNFGDGFLSKRRCLNPQDNITTVDTANPNAKPKTVCTGAYEIVTPGRQISEGLNKALGLPLDRLNLVDEFDELINALLAQLAQQAFTSIDGLKGLSSRTSSSALTQRNADGSLVQGSYLDALVSDTGARALSTGQNALLSDIDAAIANEERAQDTLETLIARHKEAKETYGASYTCFLAVGSGAPASAATPTPAAAGGKTELALLEDERSLSLQTIERLLSARARVRDAAEIEELNAASAAYDAILSSGVIHTNADVAFLASDLDVAESALAALSETPAPDTSGCTAAP